MERSLPKTYWLARIVLYALVGLLVMVNAPSVFAQGEAGVRISPALIDEAVDPNSTKEYAFTVTNLNANEQKFYISAKNISDVSNEGAPIFSEFEEEATGMELADWIVLPVSDITLPAGASQEVRFTINVPGDAAPGSHFGSVILSVDAPEIEKSGAAIGYKVANIISLRVAGDATESANIRQFSTNSFFYGSKNVDFSVRIENLGNVLLRPVGPVEIKNMLGQKVDTFVFNESQASVFPKKVREYKFTWTGEGTGFGRYEAVLSPVYGSAGAKRTISSTVSFWILPIHIIGPALGGLALLLLITYFFVKLYIRRTLAHLSYGQARVVRKRRSKGLSATLLLVIVMLTVTALFMIVLLAIFA